MIVKIEIHLDDDVPESMKGIIRCGSVISFDENDNETDHEELIDNAEYHSEKEMVDDIAKRLDVESNMVTVVK